MHLYKHTHIFMDMCICIAVKAKAPSSFSSPDPPMMSEAISGNEGDALNNPSHLRGPELLRWHHRVGESLDQRSAG